MAVGRKERRELVNHPAHYGGDTMYEVIKVLEAWDVMDFCCGNAIKYIARAKHKGSELQDLKKARWYLDRRITNLERGFNWRSQDRARKGV